MKLYISTIFLFLATSLVVTEARATEPGRQLQLLEKAIADYQKLADKNPNWETISLGDRSTLKVHDRHPSVKAIKERLELFGDLRRSTNTDEFTVRMEDAVKAFQRRHGLVDDGVIGPGFMKALNMPLSMRIQQLQVNVARIRKESTETTGKRIVANIPEYRLYVYEGDREVLSMDIVVGKTTNQTVVFSDEMKHVVFSPYWNVPESIVRNEILPAMKKNSRYLKTQNMEITGNENGLPVIRQRPGASNALGQVKFLFPNKYNIYFHDTPSKSLFARHQRAFSHGCIRLSQPFEMAKYLLKDHPEWTDDKIRAAMNAGTEKWVNLKTAVPVYITYYTAWVTPGGEVNFREDIYNKDKILAAK